MGKNRGAGIFDKQILSLLRRGLISALACLAMFSFLAFSIPLTSHATENIISDTTPTDPTVDTDTNLTGTQDERTNITDPGSAETPDDLKKAVEDRLKRCSQEDIRDICFVLTSME